jgi:hypothetical protein
MFGNPYTPRTMAGQSVVKPARSMVEGTPVKFYDLDERGLARR